MQHKGIASSLTFQRIDNLRIARGKGHRTNRLRLKCRSVRLGHRPRRQSREPCDYRARHARLARQNSTADNALLKALKNVLYVVFRRALLGRQQRHNLVFNLSNALIAFCFFRDAIRITQRARSRRLDRGYQFRSRPPAPANPSGVYLLRQPVR